MFVGSFCLDVGMFVGSSSLKISIICLNIFKISMSALKAAVIFLQYYHAAAITLKGCPGKHVQVTDE